MEDDFFWSSFNQAIGIGSTESRYSFRFDSKGEAHWKESIINSSVYSIFDTGLSAIMISGGYYGDLIKMIFRYIGSDNY